ncbi:hypothetical protein CDIK_3395 [Cucumispora dikerogammari]|nr:hypothetical protein CDIK_3395 [Cucumispora dikerogammari]
MEIKTLILKTSNILINFYQNTIQTNLNPDITEIPTVSSGSFNSQQNSTEEEQPPDYNTAIISSHGVEPPSYSSIVSTSASDTFFSSRKSSQGIIRNRVSHIHNFLSKFMHCELLFFLVFLFLMLFFLLYILPSIALKHEDNKDDI